MVQPPLPPLIVTGMHRSGASVVASVLSALSVEMRPFADIHDRLLPSLCPPSEPGLPEWGWSESERLDLSALSAFRDQAGRLAASRAEPWGWVEPRSTLLLDFWDSVAPGARYVLLYRCPWDVADSLRRRCGASFETHPDYAYRIWQFYCRRLVDFYVRHADRAVLVSVPAVRTRLSGFATLLRDKLGVATSHADLSGMFAPDRLRVAEASDPVIDLVGRAWPGCLDLLAELDRLADLPGSGLWHPPPARRSVVQLPAMPDAAVAGADDNARSIASWFRRSEGELDRLTATIAARDEMVGWLWDELKDARTAAVALERRNIELSAERERMRAAEEQVAHDRGRRASSAERRTAARLAALERSAVDQQAALTLKDGQIAHLTAMLEGRNAEVAHILSSTSWKVAAPVRVVGRSVRTARLLGRGAAAVLRHPSSLRGAPAKVVRTWRAGGWSGLTAALTRVADAPARNTAWSDYKREFRRTVCPLLVQRIETMAQTPLISIIVPTYNTPEPMLRDMLASVLAQLYPHWELCVADDGSSQPHVLEVLREYAGRDSRIKVLPGSENHGVSHASNRALAAATGAYVALLDHDDLLEPQALFRLVESFLADDADMVYSDEVLLTEDAESAHHFVFRPAFSPELLRGHPYIVHLVAFRTALLRDIGGFDESFTISQDYDLILRAAERAQTVVHVPEVLYGWRIHPASAGHQKIHEVMTTSRSILQRHLARCGERGRVDAGIGFNLFDARYRLSDGLRVLIVVPTRNHVSLLRRCIDSIRATVLQASYDIVVVDHRSDDPDTLEYLAEEAGDVQVLRYDGAFNFSTINNWAARTAAGEYTHYLFCNNDIEAIEAGWLERMLEVAEHPTAGVVGAKLLYPDRQTVQHAGVCVGAFGRAEHYAKFLRLPTDRVETGYLGALVLNHEVAAVTAACMLVRRTLFEELRGFDEHLAVGFGDVDLCLRAIERGYRVIFCPHASLVHHESSTRGTHNEHPEDTAYFKHRWSDVLAGGDPYSNPALSLNSTTWEVAYPLVGRPDVRRRIVRRAEHRAPLFVSYGDGTGPRPAARVSEVAETGATAGAPAGPPGWS